LIGTPEYEICRSDHSSRDMRWEAASADMVPARHAYGCFHDTVRDREAGHDEDHPEPAEEYR